MTVNFDFEFESGDIEDIAIEVTKTGGITSIENENVTLYKCPNMEIIDNAADISADTTAITDGFRLSYLFNSSSLAPGHYAAFFEFQRDGLTNTRHKRVDINVKQIKC